MVEGCARTTKNTSKNSEKPLFIRGSRLLFLVFLVFLVLFTFK
nr:MAG TPA: hypothetical protein [Caudoviricetes sp.]